MKVRDKVSEANQGVVDIRKIKDDLGSLKGKLGSDPQYKDLNEGIKTFEQALSDHESNIHETRNRSVQDPLNYGIKMNNQLAHLMVEQAAGDYPPTKQGEEVRQMLTKKIDDELGKLKATINQNVDRINQMAKEKGVEIIAVQRKPTDM